MSKNDFLGSGVQTTGFSNILLSISDEACFSVTNYGYGKAILVRKFLPNNNLFGGCGGRPWLRWPTLAG